MVDAVVAVTIDGAVVGLAVGDSVVAVVVTVVVGVEERQHRFTHLSYSPSSAFSMKSSIALTLYSSACITRGDGGVEKPVTLARWRATSAVLPPATSLPRASAKIGTPFSLRSVEAAASARVNDIPRPSEMITVTGTPLIPSSGHRGSRTARQAALETLPNTKSLIRDNPR